MPPNHPLQGFVFSDLHMFSYSSRYERYLHSLYDDIERADVIVLNGDTFDFKRSRYQTHEQTTHHALSWLAKILNRYPGKRFEYVLGNHDCIDTFVTALGKVSEEHRNLTVHQELVRIGRNIFLHGDICDAPPGVTDISFVRQRYRESERSRLSIVFSEIVTRTRMNVVEYLRHNRATLAERILEYLSSAAPDFESSTERIYFGHTHVPFEGFHYRGFTFINTGSAIRGLRFAPARF